MKDYLIALVIFITIVGIAKAAYHFYEWELQDKHNKIVAIELEEGYTSLTKWNVIAEISLTDRDLYEAQVMQRETEIKIYERRLMSLNHYLDTNF